MICRPLTASSIPLNSTIDLLRANPAIPRLRLRLKTDPPTLALAARTRALGLRNSFAHITEQTRISIHDWLSRVELRNGRYLFPIRLRAQPHLSTRQYARIVHAWVESVGLDSSAYGTHSMRRTKAAQIYRKTGNLRAVQLLLGHTKLESTVQYLGFTIAASCVPEAVAAHPPRKLVLFDGRSSREMGRCWLPQSRSWLRPESESSIGARRKLTSMGKSGA